MKIFLIGFMGSGKTYWGKKLSQKIKLPFFDLDDLIEQHEKKSITDIFETKGENQFRLIEKNILTQFAKTNDSFVLATGGGTPCFFNNLDYMNSLGTSIWINTDLDILFERLSKEKTKRPLIKDFTEQQLFIFIKDKLAERKQFYEKAKLIIGETEIDLEKIIKSIYHE